MPARTSPAAVLLAAWLVPGGGHYLLGRKPQAVVFFATITATFFFGMFLADFTNVSTTRHPYYFLTHIPNGAETMIAAAATAGNEPGRVPRHFGMETGEIGTLYTAVAGLLNLIVLMDVFGLALGISPKPRRRERTAAGASGAGDREAGS